ncbi:hypothetical protein AX16_005117 [Volvariella volvacea WC 439]|nr:hypothetical protein AX16_005117 [Volvariella volvacea WC 439]
MVFRVPTHFQSPFDGQRPIPTNTWRGSTRMVGMRPSDRSIAEDIRMTSLETDGSNRMELWPSTLVGRVMFERPNILPMFKTWLNDVTPPPLCTFTPDRLADPEEQNLNYGKFRTLSSRLAELRTVAVITWGGADGIPDAGIVMYPSENSSAMLLGVLFMNTPFPDFILNGSPPIPQLQPNPYYVMGQGLQYPRQAQHSVHQHSQAQVLYQQYGDGSTPYNNQDPSAWQGAREGDNSMYLYHPNRNQHP